MLEFSLIYFYTNVVAPRRVAGTSRDNLATPPTLRTLRLLHLTMALCAFGGGVITANVGSGSDIVLYAFGLYVWNGM